jgi:ubiquinone/menaquinone biosynthesis C-methylase UbiE
LLRTTALDLNLFNLQRAKSALKSYKGVTFLEANAENMPVEAESQDVVTCQFMLSRLPAEAQVNVINEMARVLKPGGKVVIIDATQTEFDGEDVCTFETLPTATLPPTYAAYQKSDLEYALIKAGLFVQEKEIAWVSKVLVAQKPPLLSQDPTNSGIYGVGF